MNKPKYIIIAGINGAGKSTLYETFPDLFEGTKRINADEILKHMNGDWRENSDNIKAMREEVKQIHNDIKRKISIHVETTLAGTGQSQIKLIEQARQLGFEITLLYVTLDSDERAIERVKERVKKGGHGVPPELIKTRYKKSHINLPLIASHADNVSIYDNSVKFVHVYSRAGNSIQFDELSNYPWLRQQRY